MRVIKTIAIIGAGNGGCAAAAHLTQRGFDIRLYGRSAGTTDPFAPSAGSHTRESGRGLRAAFAHHQRCRRRDRRRRPRADHGADPRPCRRRTHHAPHIAREQLVMAAPGHTLLLIPNAISAAGGRAGTFCDSSSLPFICRKSAPDRIRDHARCADPVYRGFSGKRSKRWRTWFARLSGRSTPRRRCCIRCSCIPTRSTIRRVAAQCRPGGIDGGRLSPLLRRHHARSRAPDRCADAERVAVAAALGVAIEPLPQTFRMGYTNAADGRRHRLRRLSQQRAQPLDQGAGQLDHRFLNEDVPYGLVAIAELARVGGVPTPCADAVIDIASIVAARAYRDEGLTRGRMGIAGMTAAEVRRCCGAEIRASNEIGRQSVPSSPWKRGIMFQNPRCGAQSGPRFAGTTAQCARFWSSALRWLSRVC